ncbi:MAG: type IV toxin-antitoxin system AbiEi family antitoxin domain-containing protein [Bryobacteraceae bacterium]|nr:type IV toxin-antitoxin system AbiEi family antitoxin domain-containing protein [Bryobacteraceae bacterium]
MLINNEDFILARTVPSTAAVARRADLIGAGLTPAELRARVAEGTLERVGRGLYRAADARVSGLHTYAQVARRVPRGVLCLLSSLTFHGLTTQMPRVVWLAIPAHAWRPSVDFVPIRVVHFSGEALTHGVEVHEVDGVAVKVYSVAKTVADLFKFRNKVGLDVAIEALREAWRERRCTSEEIRAGGAGLPRGECDAAVR